MVNNYQLNTKNEGYGYSKRAKGSNRRRNKPILEKTIRAIDKSDLRSDFASWANLASKAWNNTVAPDIQNKYDSILFAGMGGSGIIGGLVSDYATELNSDISFDTIRDYHLPSSIGKNTLVIGVSCSGNTEETLSILAEAY